MYLKFAGVKLLSHKSDVIYFNILLSDLLRMSTEIYMEIIDLNTVDSDKMTQLQISLALGA